MNVNQSAYSRSNEPLPATRFTVEAAMLAMIEDLCRRGLTRAEIAISLADAAEDYVIILAGMKDQAQ